LEVSGLTPATFLPHYLETLDSTPEGVLALLSPDIRFTVLWSVGGEAQEFAGGMEELQAYFAQREPDGQVHHVELTQRQGDTEVVLGHTTKHGERLATFTMAAQLDEQSRARRLYASRTTSLPFDAIAGGDG
jgi:CO/xanthine dehydrogenase Mo-binding subunit